MVRTSIAVAAVVAAAADLATPTPAQLRYQSTDFVALIHFNMGTFAHNGDPCCDKSNWDVKADYAAGKTRDPATFFPAKLNTTQWFDSIKGLGANIAVLTAKHGCGFTLWPTEAELPDASPYGYSVGTEAASIKQDVVQQFVDSANAAGVGYGFYYSIMKSFYLCRSFSGKNSCMDEVLPGQHNLSNDEYHKIAQQQVNELWTRYGNLTRIWVDSGLDGLGDLMDKLQPEAAGSPMNPITWCGTESGHPSHDVGGGDVWSTGDGFHGSPDAANWLPKFCDPQLFQQHIWFWQPNLKVRSLDEMIPIYHDIVGRGMVMEIAFSIDRDGLVQDTHEKVYKQLGDWVRQCYGSPLASMQGTGDIYELRVHEGDVLDRFQLEEDIVLGQRVRNYTVDASTDGQSWTTLVTGSAIGKKRIHLLEQPLTATASTKLRLTIGHAVATPQIRAFGAFAPCPTGEPAVVIA